MFLLTYQSYIFETITVSDFHDIAYNYLIGDYGVVLEGRETYMFGSAALNWNTKSISIAFIGEFIDAPPSKKALKTAKKFLQYLAFEGKICIY